MFRRKEKHPVHPLRKMIAFVLFVVSFILLSERKWKSGPHA